MKLVGFGSLNGFEILPVSGLLLFTMIVCSIFVVLARFLYSAFYSTLPPGPWGLPLIGEFSVRFTVIMRLFEAICSDLKQNPN